MALADWLIRIGGIMTLDNWLILIGAIMMLIGLGLAFVSTRMIAEVGAARRGLLLFGLEPGSPKEIERARLLKRSDVAFWLGLGFTAAGIIFQTVGALLAGNPH